VTGDGKADILTAPARGHGHARLFDLSTAALDAFFADEVLLEGSAWVAAGGQRR